jgi:hypothetical protein
MWICFNDGFLSIVQVPRNPGMLRVRARKRSHLESFLRGTPSRILQTPERDYRWRAIVKRSTIAELLKQYVLNMDYDSFKGSVRDVRLSAMYSTWWSDHRLYQDMEH